MNYIISEELRDILIADLQANAMADWYARDQSERLYNLSPIQSDMVVTKEAIVEAFSEKCSVIKAVGLQAGFDAIYALQLPAPTPQPEARGVDLSEVKLFLEEIVSTKAENKDLWIGTVKANAYGFLGVLAHLQQAPQGVGVIHAQDLVPAIHKVHEETKFTIWDSYYRDQHMALAVIDVLEAKGYPVRRWSDDNKESTAPIHVGKEDK